MKVMNVVKTLCNTGPTTSTCPRTPCPTAATITRDTVASKNGVVSSPVTFRKPTISPNKMRTETMSALSSQNPATIAIIIPTINDHVPIFWTIVCFLSILFPPISLFLFLAFVFPIYIFIIT